jgi:Ribbon-helix-helix protein, copG family
MARVRAERELALPLGLLFWYHHIMGKSITVSPKKRGRGRPPSGGRDPNLPVRVPKELVAEIEDWADKNETTRSEAIRRLIKLALAKD